jgi:hypothetical protein
MEKDALHIIKGMKIHCAVQSKEGGCSTCPITKVCTIFIRSIANMNIGLMEIAINNRGTSDGRKN